MRTFNRIVKSETEPTVNDLWLKKEETISSTGEVSIRWNLLHYSTNGWTTVGFINDDAENDLLEENIVNLRKDIKTLSGDIKDLYKAIGDMRSIYEEWIRRVDDLDPTAEIDNTSLITNLE